jgi:hypothetical protein
MSILPTSCLIWQGLEDVGEDGITPGMGRIERYRAELKKKGFVIDPPTVSTAQSENQSCAQDDDGEDDPAPLTNIPDDYRAEEVGMKRKDNPNLRSSITKREFLQHEFQHDPQPDMEKGAIQTPDDPDKYEDGSNSDE